ncbi:MAG: hypothetical protein MK095_06870, partial [Phycisphaerales bacterium]|nr:hypothetical protein [Phycisphaerales bacterium]
PDTIRPTLKALWERWTPAGRMDLEAAIRGLGESRATRVEVDRFDIDLQIDDATERLHLQDGVIVLDRSSLALEQIQIDASIDTAGAGRFDHEDGLFGLDGLVTWNDDGTTVELACDLAEGRFQSPLLGSLLDAFVGGDFPDYWRDAEPSGQFAGQAELGLVPGGDWDWRLAVTPSTLSATVRGERLSASIDHGRLLADNGVLRFDNLSFVMDAGDCRISGQLLTDTGLSGELNFDFDGRIRSREVFALLPDEATDILSEIDFQDGMRTVLQDATLSFDLRPDSGAPWSLDTAVLFRGGSIDAGVEIDEVFGRADMHLASEPNRALEFSLRGDFDSFDVLGQRLTDSTLDMRLLDDGVRLALQELSGDCAGGELAVTAMFDLGPRQLWSLRMQIADAALSRFMPVEPVEVDAEDSQSNDQREDAVDGRVFISANLLGSIGGGDRVGNGRVRIYEGELYQLPITVGIYQLLQLSTPFINSPEFVDVVWHLDGEDIELEQIQLLSLDGDRVTFSLNGEGTFDWDAKSISAVLRPRSSWLVLADVFGALQDRFYAVGVEGPVSSPEVELISFPDLQ